MLDFQVADVGKVHVQHVGDMAENVLVCQLCHLSGKLPAALVVLYLGGRRRFPCQSNSQYCAAELHTCGGREFDQRTMFGGADCTRLDLQHHPLDHPRHLYAHLSCESQY